LNAELNKAKKAYDENRNALNKNRNATKQLGKEVKGYIGKGLKPVAKDLDKNSAAYKEASAELNKNANANADNAKSNTLLQSAVDGTKKKYEELKNSINVASGQSQDFYTKFSKGMSTVS
jgi:chromosome segregation ATPase